MIARMLKKMGKRKEKEERRRGKMRVRRGKAAVSVVNLV